MPDVIDVIKGMEEVKHFIKCENLPAHSLKALLIMDDAIALLKAQEARHRLEVHNIGNVDIPEGVTWEQFQAVMENVVDALEHTDRGESWPYEEAR